MFVINDIELLERVSKHKLLSHLANNCSVAISDLRLNDYSFQMKRVITGLKEICIENIDLEVFNNWIEGRRGFLSIGDLSSIYLALCHKEATLVLSPEDDFLIDEVKNCNLPYLQFDDFFIQMIKDERALQLYNLIKAA